MLETCKVMLEDCHIDAFARLQRHLPWCLIESFQRVNIHNVQKSSNVDEQTAQSQCHNSIAMLLTQIGLYRGGTLCWVVIRL